MNLILLKENDIFLKYKQEKYVGDFSELKDISEKMFSIMRTHNGVGLAANQVGLKINMFIMKIKNKHIIINPEIIHSSDIKEKNMEGCLSFPKLQLEIYRPNSVTLKYNDIEGKELITTFFDIEARCILHEYDHLQGIVFTSKVQKKILAEARMKRAKLTGKL